MTGPLYCGTCGTWPAMQCEQGPRYHLCELRDFAAQNPVPLPNSVEALRDLASIGVAGAQEKMDTMANAGAHRQAREAGLSECSALLDLKEAKGDNDG